MDNAELTSALAKVIQVVLDTRIRANQAVQGVAALRDTLKDLDPRFVTLFGKHYLEPADIKIQRLKDSSPEVEELAEIFRRIQAAQNAGAGEAQ